MRIPWRMGERTARRAADSGRTIIITAVTGMTDRIMETAGTAGTTVQRTTVQRTTVQRTTVQRTEKIMAAVLTTGKVIIAAATARRIRKTAAAAGTARRIRKTAAAVGTVATDRTVRGGTVAVTAGLTGKTDRKGIQRAMTVILKDKERLDDLQRNGYKIIQNPEKFCFGMDAVLLCGFAYAGETDRVLDLGTGTGIIPVLMEARYGCAHLTGLEIQEESADMARRSVQLNGLQDRITIVTGDIREADSYFASASFDCITCNPPYMIGQHGLTNPDSPKAIARHELLCTLEDAVSQAAKLLKPGGHFYMVHRPFRLAEIMTVLVRHKLEPKRMQLVYPYVDKEPNMVLLQATRGGRSRMTVEKPLIVYKEPGVYMPEIYDIYGY